MFAAAASGLHAAAAGPDPNREIDPSFVISHQLPLDEAPRAYEMFRDKEEDRTKVVLRP